MAGVQNGRVGEIVLGQALTSCEIQTWLLLKATAQVMMMMVMEVMMLGLQHCVCNQLDGFNVGDFLLQHGLAFKGLLLFALGILLLEAAAATQERSVVKHVVGVRVQSPVAALSWLLIIPGHLHKALVQTEIVANGVLPALLVVPVVRESVHDVLVDAVESHFLVRSILDGHCDEGDVGVGGLHHLLVLVMG